MHMAVSRFFKKDSGILSACDIASHEDKWLAWSQFIDNFRASGAATRQNIIAHEPPASSDAAFDARIAATVEALCREAKMPAPPWVHAARFTLAQPYWAYKNPAAQEYLRKTSLPEFAARNLFCGARVLSRV